jgi:hypothetical protein
MDASPILLQCPQAGPVSLSPRSFYSLLSSLTRRRHTHPDLWRDDDIRVVHYILHDKPWMDRPPKSDDEPYEVVKRWWWASYDSLIETMTKDGRDDIDYLETLVGPKH